MGSGWGAGAKTLRIATISPVYSTAEYRALVWCRSAHTCLIHNVLNDVMRIVTPTDHLPILSGIQPAELRQMGATLSLDHWGSLDPDYLAWSFKYVLRYLPSLTKIYTRVCASCAEYFGQPRQTWHPRL